MKHKWRGGRPPFLRWEAGRPRLVLPQRWESPARWASRVATLLGVAAALLGLAPLPGFLVALPLALFQLILERSIFLFVAMHVTPLPSFQYDPDKWVSMAYLFEGPPPTGTPLAVALVFTDPEYANQMFELLRSWRRLRGAARRKGKNKEPLLLVVALVICRTFSTMAGYSIGYFLDRYQKGRPFDLLALLALPDGGARPIPGVPPIRKYHLKAKARVDLAPDEFERVHLEQVSS